VANLAFGNVPTSTELSPRPLSLTQRSRPYWRCYFPNTSAIIYVIDSSDTPRLQTSRSELLTMLSEEELAGVPLLVFCNKQDIEGALKPEEISEQLGLAGGEKGRDWSVRGSCAIEGEGIEAGLDWCVTNKM
jgi:ADP-ribosylation factor-like protein 1